MTGDHTLAAWRRRESARLRPYSHQPRHDTDRIAEHVLGLTRAQQYASADRALTPSEQAALERCLQAVQNGQPLAYVLGATEFWSLPLRVTTDVLIPRPDTEQLVERALEHIPAHGAADVLELGTGSGAIALALATERPQSRVLATDVCRRALDVARQNRERLAADGYAVDNLRFKHSDWFEHIAPAAYDVIVSNPPYIDTDDPHVATSVRDFEPAKALFADNNGLASIDTLVQDAPGYLKPGGILMLEHGWQQGAAVRERLTARGFICVDTFRDLNDHERVTLAQWPGA